MPDNPNKIENGIESVSKTALNVFDRCERKFWLRYGEEMYWPGRASDLSLAREEQMRKGKLFHDLVDQDAKGINVDSFIQESEESDIKDWWANFKKFGPDKSEGDLIFSEAQLQMTVGDVLITARYDRIYVRKDGSILIVDWKTVSQPEKGLDRLRNDWQTNIYPVVLRNSFKALAGLSDREPGPITFMYWYALTPQDPVVFELADKEVDDFESRLKKTVEDLLSRKSRDEFPLTSLTARCEDCPYAVLCNRLDIPKDGDPEMTEEEYLEEFELFSSDELFGEDLLPKEL